MDSPRERGVDSCIIVIGRQREKGEATLDEPRDLKHIPRARASMCLYRPHAGDRARGLKKNLRRILRRYAAYYNESRIHRSLDKDGLYNEVRTHLALAKTRPQVGQSSGPVALSPSQSCLGCTTIMSGYNFRKGHRMDLLAVGPDGGAVIIAHCRPFDRRPCTPD